MAKPSSTQQDRAIELLKERGITRPSELVTAGVTTATIARIKQKGLVVQLGRGLYQLPRRAIDTHHSVAGASLSASVVHSQFMARSRNSRD